MVRLPLRSLLRPFSVNPDRIRGCKMERNTSKVLHPFNFSDYDSHKIALRLSYLGWNYRGLAFQKDDIERTSNQPNENRNSVVNQSTIENILRKALLKTRLIESWETCDFSRAGRTDKGVSSMGQVCALKVRASREKGKSYKEAPIDYTNVLNRVLPLDIRVTSFAMKLPMNFDARFSCIARHYKYFFVRTPILNELDIEKMKIALTKLLGCHDFRNFCKIDKSKETPNFVREIRSAKISQLNCPLTIPKFEALASRQNVSPMFRDIIDSTQLYVVDIIGTGFLWHQIRNIMGIIFQIGNGVEDVSLIDDILDVNLNPSKPSYDMAAELPLVLWDTYYDGIDWETNATKPEDLYKHLFVKSYTEWQDALMKFLMSSSMLFRSFSACSQSIKFSQEYENKSIYTKFHGGLKRLKIANLNRKGTEP